MGAAVIAGVMAAIMAALITIGVVMRYFFRSPILGIEELSGYLMGMIVFLGLAWCIQRESMIRMDIGYQRFTGIVKFVADILIYILAGVYMWLVTWAVWGRFVRSLEQHQTSVGQLQTPLWIPNLVYAIGLLLVLVQLLVNFIRLVLTRQATKDKPEPLTDLS